MKGVAQQPKTASLRGLTVPVWLSTAKVNTRRCVEAGAHLLGAGLFIAMVRELCSLESVCARAKAGELFTMLQQLIDLQKKETAASKRGEGNRNEVDVALTLRLAHYIRRLQRDIHKLAEHLGRSEDVFALSSAQPKISTVHQDWQRCYGQQIPALQLWDPSAWLRCRVLSGRSNFDPVINILEGADAVVASLYSNRF